MTKPNFINNLELKDLNSGVSTGTEWLSGCGPLTESTTPVDGSIIAKIQNANLEEYEAVISKAQQAFKEWRKVPAPQRGEIVRQIGNAVREAKNDLGQLVSWEMGKIYQEGLGEIQEMIDICDFAVGLSRQLYGSTMHSERPGHRMYDQYHPLGIVGIISAFNFPHSCSKPPVFARKGFNGFVNILLLCATVFCVRAWFGWYTQGFENRVNIFMIFGSFSCVRP